MNAKRATVGGRRWNVARARTEEGHELAPQARVAVAARVVTAVRPC